MANDLVRLEVNFRARGASAATVYTIRVGLRCSIGQLKRHVAASMGLSGKLSFKGVPLDRYEDDTLLDHEICEGSVLELTSFKSPNRCTYPIKLKLCMHRQEKVISLKVLNTSTVDDLKHKIQDIEGIPAEKQVLKYKEKEVKSSTRTVELYKGGANERHLSVVVKGDVSDADVDLSSSFSGDKFKQQAYALTTHTKMPLDYDGLHTLATGLHTWKEEGCTGHVVAVFSYGWHSTDYQLQQIGVLKGAKRRNSIAGLGIDERFQ